MVQCNFIWQQNGLISLFLNSKQGNGGGRPARKRVSPDVQLFGEMIFGSVEMTYKGPTVKAHSIR
jgi:hypothetical protein